MQDSSPLTQTDFENIKRQLAELDKVDGQIRRAQAAGLDVTEQRKRADEQRKQLMQIKQAYFGNQQ